MANAVAKSVPTNSQGTALSTLSRDSLIALVAQLQEQLEQLRNVDVTRAGTQIILPEGMSFDEGIKWLERRKREEETEVAFMHEIKCHPLDGALALMKSLKKIYGFVDLVPTPGFFGPRPPILINVKTGPRPQDVVSVPWGRMQLPNVEGDIHTGYDGEGAEPVFQIRATIRQKDRPQLQRIAQTCDEFIRTESLYHRKALKINLAWKRDGLDFDPQRHGFQFLDLANVSEKALIVNQTTAAQLRTTLFAFIENAPAMRANGIPVKRGILLEGPYGVGKTMTSAITAKMAVDNGFTFILCDDARDLADVVRMSKQYEPCVIFCEDIDRVVLKERTLSVDDILNVIDGIESKNSELIIVLTTNHVEDLSRALLRPGRLDSVVSMGLPDAGTAQRLVELYGGKNLQKGVDFASTGVRLASQIPAVICEVMKRARISAISRTGKADITGEVSPEDVIIAADGMTRHLQLLNAVPPPARDAIEKFGSALGAQLAPVLLKFANNNVDSLDKIVAAQPANVIG